MIATFSFLTDVDDKFIIKVMIIPINQWIVP